MKVQPVLGLLVNSIVFGVKYLARASNSFLSILGKLYARMYSVILYISSAFKCTSFPYNVEAVAVGCNSEQLVGIWVKVDACVWNR